MFEYIPRHRISITGPRRCRLRRCPQHRRAAARPPGTAEGVRNEPLQQASQRINGAYHDSDGPRLCEDIKFLEHGVYLGTNLVDVCAVLGQASLVGAVLVDVRVDGTTRVPLSQNLLAGVVEDNTRPSTAKGLTSNYINNCIARISGKAKLRRHFEKDWGNTRKIRDSFFTMPMDTKIRFIRSKSTMKPAIVRFGIFTSLEDLSWPHEYGYVICDGHSAAPRIGAMVHSPESRADHFLLDGIAAGTDRFPFGPMPGLDGVMYHYAVFTTENEPFDDMRSDLRDEIVIMVVRCSRCFIVSFLIHFISL